MFSSEVYITITIRCAVLTCPISNLFHSFSEIELAEEISPDYERDLTHLVLVPLWIQVQFGHAGACANQASETAVAKNKALQEAGVFVPKSFDELGEVIK